MQTPTAIEQIGPHDAYRRMQDGCIYLDVRSVSEFERGHAAGAVNVPLFHAEPGMGLVPNPDFLVVCAANFSRDVGFVVGCAMGARSQRACELLAAYGYTRLANVEGGFSGARDATGRRVAVGWVDLGLPVSVTPGAGCDYASLAGKLGG